MKPSIVFSGLTSCGKTYSAHRVRDEFKLRNITASQFLLDLGTSDGLCNNAKSNIPHIWLGPLDVFNRRRERDSTLDKEVDRLILNELTHQGSAVVESLTAAFLLKNTISSIKNRILKIYIQADYNTRVSRALRPSPSVSSSNTTAAPENAADLIIVLREIEFLPFGCSI